MWLRLLSKLANWVQNQTALRLAFPPAFAGVSFLLLLISLHTLFFGTLERHFVQSYMVAFEVGIEHPPNKNPLPRVESLDKEILSAIQAMEAVEERVVLQRDARALVLLRVRQSQESLDALASRITTLLPPQLHTSKAVTWPLLPTQATLFRRFGNLETKAQFESDAAVTAEKWLSEGNSGIAMEHRLEVRTLHDRLQRWGIATQDIQDALERGLSPRPPLPGVERNRILPSAWENVTRTPGEVATRVLELTVETRLGQEVPLSDLSTVVWTRVPQLLPSSTLAPEPTEARPWLASLAQERISKARAPWWAHWSREDLLLAGGIFIASACLGIVTLRSIKFPLDGLFLLFFLGTFSSFFLVSPMSTFEKTPQGWLLVSSALLWAVVRSLPWRLSRRAREGWSASQVFLFAGVFVALAFGFLNAPDGGVASSLPWQTTHVDSPEHTPDATGERRVLKHGMPLRSGLAHSENRHLFSREVSTDKGNVRVTLLNAPAMETVHSQGPAEFLPATRHATLEALRNGAEALLRPSPVVHRNAQELRKNLLNWMSLTLVSAAFCGALLGGGFAHWATLSILQTIATLMSGAFAWALSYLSVPLGLDVGSVRIETLVPWSVAVASVSLVWLHARTQQFQARQKNTFEASRLAARPLLHTALSLLLCAIVLWPTVLLLDRFVSAAVLSAFWIASVFLLPCLSALVSHQIWESIRYNQLARRIQKLSLRIAPRGTSL